MESSKNLDPWIAHFAHSDLYSEENEKLNYIRVTCVMRSAGEISPSTLIYLKL